MTAERRKMRRLALTVAVLALWPGSARTATAAGAVVRERAEPTLLGAAVSRDAPARFDMVGFHWQGAGSLLFRTRSASGRWGAWERMTPAASSDAGEEQPIWVGASDRLEYRLDGDVRELRATYVQSVPLAVPPSTVSVAGSPLIVPRETWGAKESLRRARPVYAPAIKLVIVHHTAGTNAYSRAASAAIVRGIYAYHVQANGWNDIGYNFLVDRYGQVFEGRYGGIDQNVVGAHAAGFNRGTVGIAVIGSYGSSSITPAARLALERLIAWRLDVAHVDPVGRATITSAGNERYRAGKTLTLPVVSGHRDTGSTSCPGARLAAGLPAIARGAAAIGLPKLFAPEVSGTLGGSVRFRANLSGSLRWAVTVSSGETTVATGSGEGKTVDWTWNSSGLDASVSYRWTISADRARPASGALAATEKPRPPKPPAPPPTPQELLSGLAIDPENISPNGDGVGDTLTVSYTLRDPATVVVSALSSGGATTELARQDQQAGPQTLQLVVDSLADGSYQLHVQAQTAGEQAETSVPFAVSRAITSFSVGSPPAAQAAFSPNGDHRLDQLRIEFDLAQAVNAELSILRDGTPIVTLLSGMLSKSPQGLAWDGTASGAVVLDGDYQIRLLVGDPGAQSEQRLDVRVDTQPPELAVVSWAPLRLTSSEGVHVVALVNGRRHELDVPAGSFMLPAKASITTLCVAAVDAAGNRFRRQFR